jgi:RNA polymerase sigma-70 factor (ECF subfamily)
MPSRFEVVNDRVFSLTHQSEYEPRISEYAEAMTGHDLRTDAEILSDSVIHPEQFEVVFERHFESVVRFAAGRVGMAHAGDVAGEVFERAFNLRHRFDTSRPTALPWLFGIATNVCREHLRRTARRAKASRRAVNVADRGAGSFEWEAAERIDALVRRDDLVAALISLSEDEYAVLTLVALGGHTYQEVADHLRIPIGTVRSRLARAKRKVRELLEPDRSIPADTRSPAGDSIERIL